MERAPITTTHTHRHAEKEPDPRIDTDGPTSSHTHGKKVEGGRTIGHVKAAADPWLPTYYARGCYFLTVTFFLSGNQQKIILYHM